MIVAGLDSALRRSGVAVLNGDRFVHAESFLAKGEKHGEIFHNFRLWLRPFLKSHGVEYLAIEEPLRSDLSKTEVSFQDNGAFGQSVKKNRVPITTMKTLLGLYGARAHAIEVCAAVNIPCIEINNQAWRDVIYGQRRAPKGTKNSSEWWKQKALERCRQLGWPITSKDAAEAAMIAEWLRIHLGLTRRANDLFEQEGVSA